MIALSGQPSAFSYNGLGNRLQQTINGQSTRYALDINTSLPNVLSDGSRTYTYGLGNLSQSTGTATDYFLGDALGSTRQLTNSGGQIGLTESYEPFGTPVASAGTASSIFGYAGQQTDISGLQFLRARYYQPMQGRFLNRDSFAGYVDLPQTLNQYVYGLNNPVRYTDPSGNAVILYGLPLGISVFQALPFIQAIGSLPCVLDQLAQSGEIQALAFMLQLQEFQTALQPAFSDFAAGVVSELLRANFWWLPPVQTDLAVQPDESTAMLLGRVMGGALSIAIGLWEVGAGLGGGAGGTILGCGTTACMVSPAAIAIGGAIVVYGGVTALSGARDLGGSIALLLQSNGGYNSGAYNNYKNRSSSEIRKAIRGYEKQVAIHQDKIANPQKYVANWNQLSPERQQYMIQGWNQDIARNSDLANLMRSILLERGETP